MGSSQKRNIIAPKMNKTTKDDHQHTLDCGFAFIKRDKHFQYQIPSCLYTHFLHNSL